METDYIKLFSSSSIIINRLKTILAYENITCIIKNHGESGRLAGFGTLDNSVELFVLKSDYNKANEMANRFQILLDQ